MSKLSLLLISSLLALTYAQKRPDFDDVIKSILNTTPSNSNNVCGYEKECVARFQCNDGQVNTDGRNIIDIRLIDGNVNECNNVLEVCCDTNQIKASNPVIITNPRTEQVGCGYRNRDGVGFRIIGDLHNEAQFGEFPWMVAVLNNTSYGGMKEETYVCGGSIIAPTVILTGAHCIKNNNPNVWYIRAGDWDSKSTTEVYPHQDRQVREIIIHESFNSGSLQNDIALMIVESAFEWADNVRPVCLPPTDLNFDYSQCYATGWGRNKYGRDGVNQAILKKVDLPIVPHGICQEHFRKNRLGRHFQLHESFICAGGEEGKDTCEGDGGSPLVCPIVGQKDRFYQAGIVAWGLDCGLKDVPGAYTNVAHLRPWINEKLRAKGVDMSFFTP